MVINDINASVSKLRFQLLDATNTADHQEAVCKYVETIMDIRQMATVLDELDKEVRSGIAAVIAETGVTSWDTEAGTVIVTAPSVRVSYDSRALEVLMRADADIAMKLFPYRKETNVAGSMTIRGK